MSLVRAGDLPQWYAVYPGIYGGYRAVMSPWEAAKSAFQWHNETLNIYTHLLVGLWALYKLYFIVGEPYYTECSPECKYMISSAWAGAGALGLFSAFAHTFFIVDKDWFTGVWKLDFLGIVAVNFPHHLLDSFLITKALMGNRDMCLIAFTAETIFAGFVAYRIVACDLDVGRFWALAYPIVTSVPLTLPLYVYSRYGQSDADFLAAAQASVNCTLFIFIAGGLFFKGGIPERFWNPRGIFDYFGSHTWHHIFIIASIMSAFSCTHLLQGLEA